MKTSPKNPEIAVRSKDHDHRKKDSPTKAPEKISSGDNDFDELVRRSLKKGKPKN